MTDSVSMPHTFFSDIWKNSATVISDFLKQMVISQVIEFRVIKSVPINIPPNFESHDLRAFSGLLF